MQSITDNDPLKTLMGTNPKSSIQEIERALQTTWSTVSNVLFGMRWNCGRIIYFELLKLGETSTAELNCVAEPKTSNKKFQIYR